MEFFLIRTAFFSLSSFNFLNFLNILNVPLHFSWFILFIVSFLTWFFWEKIYKNRFDFPNIIGGFLTLQLYTDTLGNAFKFYDKFRWYDRLTHFTGGATVGVLIILILSYFHKKNQWNIGLNSLIVFSISLSLTISVFYEFWEYFVYSVLGYKSVITGLTDTSHDLVFDFLGSSLVALVFTVILKKRYYFSSKLNDSTKK